MTHTCPNCSHTFDTTSSRTRAAKTAPRTELTPTERAGMTDDQARKFYAAISHITDANFVFRHQIDGALPFDLRVRWAELVDDAEKGAARGTVRKRLAALQAERRTISSADDRTNRVPAIGTDEWFAQEGIRPVADVAMGADMPDCRMLKTA